MYPSVRGTMWHYHVEPISTVPSDGSILSQWLHHSKSYSVKTRFNQTPRVNLQLIISLMTTTCRCTTYSWMHPAGISVLKTAPVYTCILSSLMFEVRIVPIACPYNWGWGLSMYSSNYSWIELELTMIQTSIVCQWDQLWCILAFAGPPIQRYFRYRGAVYFPQGQTLKGWHELPLSVQ
jgi:hypothetical protein